MFWEIKLDDSPPYFPFYPSDFLSHEQVNLMTNQEVGCYIKLLCHQWKAGSIPSEIDKIARLCKENGTAMAQLWPSIKPCFKENGDGRLFNQRLKEEWEKLEAFRRERSASGQRGAASRWGKKDDSSANGSAIAQPMAKNGISPSPSLSDIKNKKPEPYRLPSEEEITEASLPKVKILIGKVCKELYERDIFPKSNAFANMTLKKKANPRSVLHTLVRVFNAKPEDSWGYAMQIMKVEDQNFNERDYQKTTRKNTGAV